jgi:ATP-dependent RNA helicase DeaD
LTTEGVVSWEFAPTFDAAHRAALASGKPLIYVCPPAGWALAPLLARFPSVEGSTPDMLVLAPEPADAVDIAAAARGIADRTPVHACTGLTRTRRLLSDGAVRTLVCTPADAVALARQAALSLAALPRVVVAWPEHMVALDQVTVLDTVLSESQSAHRLIATTDEQLPSLTDLFTRVAHRAPVVAAARAPEQPRAGVVRWLAVGNGSRAMAATAVLDVLHPGTVVLWNPHTELREDLAPLLADPAVVVFGDILAGGAADLVIALDLPSAEVLAALAEMSRDQVFLVRPSQIDYVHRLVADPRPVRVVGEADRALDRALSVRRQLRARLADGGLDGELLTLGPLLDEFDPALVAAAALAMRDAVPGSAEPAATGWTRILVSAGRRDGIRAGDIVGALTNEVGLTRTAVGKIDLRDNFALVEIQADEAEHAARGLTGTSLRGHRVTARLERR